MTSLTIVYIVIAFVLAISIAVFHYTQNLKNKEKVGYLLTFLRFLSLFALLLLLINPKIEKQVLEIVKPKLVVVVDDSKSIAHFKQEKNVAQFVNQLQLNTELNDKFNIDYYSFGSEFKSLDSLSFTNSNTNLSKPLKQIKSIYKDSKAPIIFITDGNQTIGSNYEFERLNQPVFPIVVGDTTKYTDVRITQLNVNKYTYLNNKFPVEVYLNYDGDDEIESEFSIFKGRQKVISKKIKFSKNKNSQHLSFYIMASEVGVHYFSANIANIKNEKNGINNKKQFVVEVIDEQSKLLLLTSFMHPDIGSLKESIEQNKQRKVDIKLIGDDYNLEEYQAVLLYQPTRFFKTVFEQIKIQKLNYGIITGSKTDWKFLNSVQSNFSKNVIQQTEDYQAVFNPSFASYSQNNIGFNLLPPLLDKFGEISFSVPFETLLWQKINELTTQNPLLVTFEEQDIRIIALFGENSWRWRMTSFLTNQSFTAYDNFISKSIQYLSSSNRAKRLSVESESIYYLNNENKITANFMDKNFQFNPNATLWLSVQNKQTNTLKRFPFSLVKNNYVVLVSELEEGTYSYTASVENQKEVKHGSFRIVDFDVEAQFTNVNIESLKRLSENNNGTIYYLNNSSRLLQNLLEKKSYLPIQKASNKINSLIDWQWLLGLIILSLSVEWFIRKYKGLI